MIYADMIQSLTILARQAASTTNYVPSSPDFMNIIPNAIDYAEDRIYREMTFLATRAQDSSLTFSGNSRSLNLSQATTVIIVPEGLSIITPVGAIPALGTRLPFLQTSLDVIDMTWPTESLTVDPSTVQMVERRWALLDAFTVVVCPTPNLAYGVEITGLFRPLEISAANPTTYISTWYPDLMIAACMIFISGYMRNFGAQADNPQMATSWEAQYKTLSASAGLEEQRRRGQGQGWSNNAPTPLATPART